MLPVSTTTKQQEVDTIPKDKLGFSMPISVGSLVMFLFAVMSPCTYARCAFTTSSSSAFRHGKKTFPSAGSFLFRPEPCNNRQFGTTHRFAVNNDEAAGENNIAQPSKEETSAIEDDTPLPEVYLSQGLFAVEKPLEWTSQDVVSYIRGMLTRDARDRGAIGNKRTTGKRKKNLKVGHGGTLDPLATGVLVLGVGSGTKQLQGYLSGDKRYGADVQLGFETATLDMEGNITKTAAFDHVTLETIEEVIPQFVGNISQIPPIYSAIKKQGRKMYEEARDGKTEEELDIPPRNVFIESIQLLPTDSKGQGVPEHFSLDVQCGGGTYIRSLVRDIGTSLNTYATMTGLERTRQGPFTLENALPRDQWNVDNVYEAIQKNNDASSE